MVYEIAAQAICNVFALRHHAHTGRQILQNLGHEQWIVCAAQDDAVDQWVEVHNLVEAFFHKVVGAG